MRTQDWRTRLDTYDFACVLTPLFTQVGIERHINNVAMQGLYLEGRLRHRMGLLGGQSWCAHDDILLRPRATATHFIRETLYPAEITVAVRLVALGADHYRLALAMFQEGHCMGVQECLMGAWRHTGGDTGGNGGRDTSKDGDTGSAWVPLPAALRERLETALAPVNDLPAWPLPAAVDGFERFPAWPRVIPRYADRDADRYLSEKTVARYVEQSRMGTLNLLGHPELVLMVARTDMDYRRWVPGLPGEAAVALPGGIVRIGNSSVVVRGAVRIDGETVAVSDSVLVSFDPLTRRPVPIEGALRRDMEALSA